MSKINSGRPLASPEKVIPENLKCQTFLITLSPKVDVTDETVKQFKNYILKKTLYSFIVTEVGDNGKKHIHAACTWSVPIDKRNIHDYWSKKMVESYPGSIGRYACKVTIQYDHKWYEEYLRKGGEVIYDNYERGGVEECFPSAEQQARLCEIKGAPEVRLHLLDQMLAEWVDKDTVDSSYESAIRFMKHRMYVENKTPYYADARKMHEACWFLYEKRNQIIEANVDDRNFGARKTGNTIIENYRV